MKFESLTNRAIAIAFLLFPGGLQARPSQNAGPVIGADRPTCKGSIQKLFTDLRTPESVVSTEGDACIVTHLKIQRGGARSIWEVDQVRIQQVPGSMPIWSAVRMQARGIRYAPDVRDNHSRYVIRAQQRPLDVRLNYILDLKARTFDLKELTIESPSLGRASVSLTGVVSSSKADSFPGLKAFGITRIHIQLDNKAIFESYILPLWVGSIPDEQDPANAIPE